MRWKYEKILFLILSFIFLFNCNTTVYGEGTILKVAFKSDIPVYQFINGYGEAMGLHIDLLNEIAANNNLSLEYVPMDNIESCLKSLEEGDVDIILGLPIYVNHNFNNTIEISNSDLYMIASKSFLNGRELQHIRNYSVAFEYDPSNYSVTSNIDASIYVVVGNQEDVLNANLKGADDVMISDSNIMPYLLSERGIEDEYAIVSSYVNNVAYTISIQKDNIELLRLINNEIVNLRVTGKYDEIRNQWISLDRNHYVRTMIYRLVFVWIITFLIIETVK